ncbi:MAG: aminomethyl-transferring glycine dehydrogenase, partial [Verrucomicrobiota bacterium]
VPLGFGGPHAAFLSCRSKHQRKLPGRVVGQSLDANGRPGYRLSLQTREQHIRRDKATSNICTAQVLLAVMASMYAVYHGPEGLKAIAHRIHRLADRLGRALGVEVGFDTLKIPLDDARRAEVLAQAQSEQMELRVYPDGAVGLTLDEKSTEEELALLADIFEVELPDEEEPEVAEPFRRSSPFLEHSVFHEYRSETEMMRYLHRLSTKDLALNTSMIPLGSCTMKLNAAAEMMPLSWPEVHGLHPFSAAENTRGYDELISNLEDWLASCTGFDAVSLQPNAGSQGEYAGLLAIRDYHASRGEAHRTRCLIPTSAHGTNPASAVMAGMDVVPVRCDEEGNVDVADLREKAEHHAEFLSALMITYPSTHGVFEESVIEICKMVHESGGQVYMDGANLNAQLGWISPAELGADVCHLNLHKTFCIPHGGGGPGVGPIAVAKHLAPFLPGHSVRLERREGAVCSAPYGSASILTISWMYIRMMGAEGLSQATAAAILSANYMAARLQPYYPILFTGANGLVAHECILDLRPFRETAGVEVEDVAKRLMDYGFHAPTMSWPVAGSLMIEPTESESRAEMDRFCEAMISIHGEIQAIIEGKWGRDENPLKHAPHTAESLLATEWNHPYTREEAAFPASFVRDRKYWPPVRRIDNVYGDRNLVCTCQPVEAMES